MNYEIHVNFPVRDIDKMYATQRKLLKVARKRDCDTGTDFRTRDLFIVFRRRGEAYAAYARLRKMWNRVKGLKVKAPRVMAPYGAGF